MAGITPIHIIPRSLQVAWAAALHIVLISWLTTGCAYRFTNQHLKIPPKIKTLAVEAVYDTSREVLPHELIWDSFQRAFSKDGHLRVVDRKEADVLLRIHIDKADAHPTGNANANGIENDKFVNVGPAPEPRNLRSLKEAGRYTTSENVSIRYNVEVIDLYEESVIFKKSYNDSANFASLQANQVADERTWYLWYEESLRARVKTMSDRIAENVVRDFTVGR